MKKLLFIPFSIVVTTIACRAQKPVAKLTSNQFIIHNTTFKIVRGHERVQIINSKNKLTNVQMITPKLPSDVRIAEYAR